MKRYSLLIVLAMLWCGAKGQSPIILEEGSILFERKINSYSLMQEMGDLGGLKKEKIDAYKSGNPAFKTSLFLLQFGKNSTVYKSAKDGVSAPASNDEWFSMVANDNVVYTNLERKQAIIQKTVFGSAFTVADTARRIKWKITDEMRPIAGFQCRRANAVIMDSIYVVAFYTNEIVPQGGPESFNGLPGMILGLALPYEHITWFAKEVYSSNPAGPATPAASNAVNMAQFVEKLSAMTKGWGPVGPLILRKALL